MATIKLNTTCGELVDLMNGHFAVQDVPGNEFALVISKNMNTLQEVLGHIEVKGRPSEEFMKFAQDMQKLQQAGDKDGLALLEKNNADLIAERKLQMEKVQDMLKESAKAELEVISKDLLPADATAKQINNLEKIIV